MPHHLQTAGERCILRMMHMHLKMHVHQE